jgi:hypothetical protein
MFSGLNSNEEIAVGLCVEGSVLLNIWEFPHRSRQSSYHTQFILTVANPWCGEGITSVNAVVVCQGGWRKYNVSRQLQAVDCDVDGGIVMKEIAVGLCVARGLLSSLSRIPT